MIPTAIVSNHPRETYGDLDFGDIPFHHLPVTKETKREQEGAVWNSSRTARPISSCWRATCRSCRMSLSAKLSGRCINIHHSFLPGFKGRALSPGA